MHSEAKKRREERGKKEKRGKPNKTNIDTETVIVSDFYGIDKPSLVSIRGSLLVGRSFCHVFMKFNRN